MRRLRHLLSLTLLIIFTLVAYANSVNNDFVYDDKDTIVENILIKDLSNLPKLFQSSYHLLSGEMTYRPVVTFTYFLDYAAFGLKPWGFHLTNILFHATNSVLLYIFLSLFIRLPVFGEQQSVITGSYVKFPLLVSILFVTHPVLTEAVNAVSFREDLLMFLFYMATLNIYLIVKLKIVTGYKRFLYATSCLFYLLALLSKEMAITLPLIISVCELFYNKKKINVRYILLNKYNIGYIVVTLLYFYIRFYYFQNPIVEGVPAPSLITRIMTAPWLLLSYLKLSFFPLSLAADYEIMPVKAFFSYHFMFSVIGMLTVAILAFLAFKIKNSKEVAFGFVFFAITLIPVYNIYPIANPFAERYLYLPVMGITVITGYVIDQGMNSKYRSLCTILFLVILSIYAFTVIKRNNIWKDDYVLWHSTVRKQQSNSQAHNKLGIVYAETGRLIKAEDEFNTALRLKSDDSVYHYNLGNVYFKQGRYYEAIKEYQSALNRKKISADAHYKLGSVYRKLGRLDEAIQEFNEALKQNPYNHVVYNDLGTVYANQGWFDKAVEEFLVAIRLNPSDKMIYNNLGLAYVNLGRFDEAVQAFATSLQLNPNSIEAHYYLGVAYLKKGLKAKAKEEFEAVLRLRPDNLQAHQVLESLK